MSWAQKQKAMMLMQGSGPAPSDPYPVDTELVEKYVRDEGTGWHVGYTINQTTGAYENNEGSDYASEVFIPVDHNYTIEKNTARMQYCGWYDANKAFISGFREYNTTAKPLTIPENAKFMRISTNSTGAGTGNSRLKLTRTA